MYCYIQVQVFFNFKLSSMYQFKDIIPSCVNLLENNDDYIPKPPNYDTNMI